MIILPTPGTGGADTLNTFKFNFVCVLCFGVFFLIKHQNLAQSERLTVHRP